MMSLVDVLAADATMAVAPVADVIVPTDLHVEVAG